MSLNTSNWKSFLLKDLFEIKMGDKLDKNKMTQDCPTVNFVSRISNNNGVDLKVDLIDNLEPNKAGLLTVSLGGEYLGSCYVQKEPFYTAQNVAIMAPRFPQMNLYVNQFICTLVKFECKTKYYAFGRELNTHINKDFEINLPIIYEDLDIPFIDKTHKYSANGYVPDWEFMENYINSLNSQQIRTDNKESKIQIDFQKWREFKLSSLLSIRNGKGITSEEVESNPGSLRAIQSGEDNNGVMGYIDLSYCQSKGYTVCLAPCLTVARTGSAGFVSFQKDGCVVGDSAKILQLEPEHATIPCYLFIQTLLKMNQFKYDYGRKVTEKKYLNEIIILPIKFKNNEPVIDKEKRYSKDGFIPDWEYMEKYIKSLPFGDRL